MTVSLMSFFNYVPYIIASVFAGSFVDSNSKKKIMLASDSIAALGSAGVFVLSISGGLQIWNIYLVNFITGFMNAFQGPASAQNKAIRKRLILFKIIYKKRKEDISMSTIYVYVLDTLADWELGHVISELNSGRFFKKGVPHVSLKTVSCSKEPINTMGGLTIMPDCLIEDMISDEKRVLLLPGADTWNDPKHSAIIEKAGEFLSVGATVCAICGATAALANYGLLDKRPHTSNGAGFLDMVSPCYKGQSFYIDEPSVADNNLITASSTGALLWAKQIIERLDVFKPDTLEHWYQYFSTGEPEHFFALMQSL